MKKAKSTFLLVVGLLSIILSIVCFSLNIGARERDNAYGGDAYTGIQNASAQTANNVYYLNKIVKTGIGSILLVAGCAFIICGLPEGGEAKANNTASVLNPVETTETESKKAEQSDSLPEI